jgi:voltage-gated potassium channel
MTPRPRFIRRQVERFRADPSSIRNAVAVVATVTIATVILGSVVIWLFDRDEFPDFPTAVWFMLQTITTVGYGDVAPVSPFGRFVAGVVMVVAIGFVSIVTALITATFVEAAQRRQRADEDAVERDRSARIEARLDEVVGRLAAIEAGLDRSDRSSDPTPSG